jgi:hypothetical protein
LDAYYYPLVVYFSLLVIIALGIILFPKASVNPEYINGVLTASSILFGFWFIMLERKPKNERFLGQVRNNLLFSLGLLILTVMLMYFATLSNSALLSEITLGAATVSFIVNLDDEIHYRNLTFSTLAKHLLETNQEKE